MDVISIIIIIVFITVILLNYIDECKNSLKIP
jgi:hypothetical protein